VTADSYAKAVTALGTGDVLMVTRLYRLARSTCDLSAELGPAFRSDGSGHN
jgi:hypothetical protein